MSPPSPVRPVGKRAIRRLPVQHRFHIRPDGEASSQQCLTVPAAWLPDRVALPLTALGPLYFRLLPRLTLWLIRTRHTDEAVRFELFGLLPLLCFGSPTFHEEAGGGRACYPLMEGWMLASHPPKQGLLCLTMARDDAGLRLCMEVEHYYTRLAGSGHPSRLRRLLYETTQAALHRWIATAYLHHLAITIAGRAEGGE